MSGKFNKKKSSGSQQLSTASLPDIVFMLLFFFMVTTTMRENELFLKNKLPHASEVKKLEKKSLVSFIYIGAPKNELQAIYGTEPKIQLNDQFSKVSDIAEFISKEREAKDENEVPLMTTSLKVDENTKMGIVTEVKQALRNCNALKISYSGIKGKK
jgi:biopolymer transport protein ExbD